MTLQKDTTQKPSSSQWTMWMSMITMALAFVIWSMVSPIAPAGEYQAELVKGIPPEILSKFFKKTDSGQFRVETNLRERITFRKHNLLSDTYPSELDLIVCRNVLIYFTDEAKAQIYQKFARSLRKGGVLFLGSTEQIFHPEEIGLRQIEPFFYQKG